ncbi:MAG: CYTH domain-containing protein [Enterococcus sp.]
MAQNIEIEFKTLLSEKEYLHLLDIYAISEKDFHKQTNVYFDTPTQELKNKNCGLRIRLLDTSAEFTLKTPEKTGLLETTDILTLKQANEYILENALPANGEVAQKIAELGIQLDTIQTIGQLTTKRAEFAIDEGLLAIDESWARNLHDYELELEVQQTTSNRENFLNLLEKHGISYKPADNKIKRMLTALH